MKLIAIISLILLSFISNAQLEIEWTKRFEGNNDWNNHPKSIKVDDSDNVYVMGKTLRDDSVGFELIIIKYNSNGKQLWKRYWTYGNYGHENPSSMLIDSEGNIYIAGYITYTGMMILKFDKDGNEIWSTVHSGQFDNYSFASMKFSHTKDFIYVAAKEILGDTEKPVFIKYDTNGNVIWEVGYEYGNFIKSFTIDSEENLIATGITNYIYNPFDYLWYGGDVFTIKYNSSGTFLWFSTFESPNDKYESGRSVSIDKDDNIYVTGMHEGSNYDIITLSYSPEGTERWVDIYSQSDTTLDIGQSIIVGKNNQIYILGYDLSTDDGSSVLNLTYDLSGNILWKRNYINLDNDGALRPSNMIVDKVGNVYSCGFVHDLGGKHSVAVKAYDQNGNDLFEEVYNSSGFSNESTVSMTLDNKNSLYVLVRSDSLANLERDFLTIKYSNPVSIRNKRTNEPTEFEIKPNPIVGTSYLNLGTDSNERKFIEIFDLFGRRIKIIETNGNQISIESNNYVSGQYYFIVSNKEGVQGYGKMIIIE